MSLPAGAFAQSNEGAEAAVPASSDDQPWLVWHTHNFFSTCDLNCAVALYAGREITTDMTSAFLIENPVAPWHWQVGNSGIVAGAFSRRFATLFGLLDLEVEAGIAQRFGDMHATEGWLAADFRWTYFPWNDYVRTTIALAEGGDYADQIDLEERRRAGDNRGSNFLNFFSPEITFAAPEHPEDELLLRFHHRSGVFGLIDGVYGGSSFGTIGFRHRF
jgi:hypothetical protein